MIITYYGLQFFKLQVGDLVIAVNPIAKGSKEKTARFGANIALITTNHPDMNGAEQVTHGDKKPFVANGPGEYEVEGVPIRGFLTKTKYGSAASPQGGKGERPNTIYFFSIDSLDVCFLGALDDATIPPDVYEKIYNVDILFVPVGGGEVLTPSAAYKLALSFEPKLIIPMHYGEASSKELKTFLDEAGAENARPEEKLTLKKKDVESKTGEVVVLKPLTS
ncbi:MAG: MBL fold metallo-hydrolase [Parcubacteria group bacterium]|nr:MBL fold metallo-hydrolase [Parcubacteria group bacterium]